MIICLNMRIQVDNEGLNNASLWYSAYSAQITHHHCHCHHLHHHYSYQTCTDSRELGYLLPIPSSIVQQSYKILDSLLQEECHSYDKLSVICKW